MNYMHSLITVGLVFSFSCQMPVTENTSERSDTETPFLPIHADGWTHISPSSDSRIVYISEDGNDSTGQVYASTDYADPCNPSPPPDAFATYAAAFARTREGYPDWILFRRGDIFYDYPGTQIRSGRGVDEPFLIGSYGEEGASPLVKTGTHTAVSIAKERPGTPQTCRYVTIQGIRFYAHTRNPDDPDFAGYGDAGHGLQISTYNSGNVVGNILIEGCGFSYYRNNIVLQASGDRGSVADIHLRRNTLFNAWSVTSHSQGLYAAGIHNLLVEENVFDHNGWLIQSSSNDRTGGGATFHNHNLYSDGVQNGVYRGNMFLRASSIGTKIQGNAGIDGMVVENNLYVDGEIGIESCNNYHDNHYRVHDPVVSDNVFYELGLSNPTSRDVGWGMWLQGWDGGEVHGNLLIGHQGQMFFNLGLRSRGIDIYDNIGLMTTMYGVYHSSDVALTDIDIHDNYFEKLTEEHGRLVLPDGASIDGIHFSANRYYSPRPLEFMINQTPHDQEQWVSQIEPDAVFTKQDFADPTRTIESYMSLHGKESSLESFYDVCRSQERYHWDLQFTASAINDWMREGFGGE